MSPLPDPATKHVPAWKKLGLKLKFAKEDVENIGGEHDSVKNSKKRKSDYEEDIPAVREKPAKKPKRSKSTKEGHTQTPNGHSKQIENGFSPPVATPTTPPTKTKSVSFTPETKTEDGEGVKQLYKTWLDKEKANDPSFEPSSTNPALRSITPTTAATNASAKELKKLTTATPASNSESSLTEPKRKKDRKKKQPVNTSHSSSPPTDHPALIYLQSYKTSPNSWKFSKSHQNYLLKHLFSFTHIPSSYDTFLLSYLRGLRGSARSRIRQQALTIRKEDEDWLATELTEDQKMDQETTAQCLARHKRDYDAAVARVKKQLREKEDEREEREWEILGEKEEWEERIRKRRRAEVVLWGIGEEEEEEVVEEPVAPSVEPPKMAIFGNSRPAIGPQAVTIQSRGMGGVRQISNGGIAEGSAGRKIKFDDDGAKPIEGDTRAQKPNGVDAVKTNNSNGINGVQAKKPRKRQRRTGVPDDDESSSESSSSSSSSEDETDRKPVKTQGLTIGRNTFSGSGTSSSDSDSGSDSDSAPSSSGNSDDAE